MESPNSSWMPLSEAVKLVAETRGVSDGAAFDLLNDAVSEGRVNARYFCHAGSTPNDTAVWDHASFDWTSSRLWIDGACGREIFEPVEVQRSAPQGIEDWLGFASTPLSVILEETPDLRAWVSADASPLDDAVYAVLDVHPKRMDEHGDKKAEFEALQKKALGAILAGKLDAYSNDGTRWVEPAVFLKWLSSTPDYEYRARELADLIPANSAPANRSALDIHPGRKAGLPSPKNALFDAAMRLVGEIDDRHGKWVELARRVQSEPNFSQYDVATISRYLRDSKGELDKRFRKPDSESGLSGK